MALADFSTPGTPHWWLVRLDAKLTERNQQTKIYEDYYEGDHRLAFAMSKYRRAFGELFSAFASNWCKLLVDAPVERLSIEGFRFGKDRQGDQDAWAIWQRNGLDADSVLAHTESVKVGSSYLIVEPGDPVSRITVEHPTQVIVAAAEGNRRRRAAALKRWTDDISGREYATVYLPQGIYRFERGSAISSALIVPYTAGLGSGGWRERAREPFETTNPLGVVPVIALENDPHLVRGGRSDLHDVIPLQDAINKTITDALVASEFHGFPQRWATGVEIPTDPETNKPRTDVFMASSGSIWSVASKDASFGQFAVGDLSNYRTLGDMLVRHLSAQTRTPPHYLVGEVVNVSGDALKAAETGLIAKVHRKQVMAGEAWEEALRLAFLLQGDTQRGRSFDAETIWAEAESRSWGELVDAAVKMRQVNVPYEAIWEFLGFSQKQISDFRKTVQLPEPALNADPSDQPGQAPGVVTPPTG